MDELLSTQNKEKVRKLVVRAAAAKFGRGKARPVFEHGQWWVQVPDPDGDRDLTFSVVDAEPSVAGTGLDFEES
jgi:hypothetical protein